jgi:hypothetical protein
VETQQIKQIAIDEIDLKNPDGVLTFALNDIFGEIEKVMWRAN